MNNIGWRNLTYLNALYAGLNQKMYDAGVKRMQYRMDKPNIVPSPI
jgi:hypothetical protein